MRITTGIDKGSRTRFKKGDVFIDNEYLCPADCLEKPRLLVISVPKYVVYTPGKTRWDCEVLWLTEGKYNYKRTKYFFYDKDIQLPKIILIGEISESTEPKTEWEVTYLSNSSTYGSSTISYNVSTITSTTNTNWYVPIKNVGTTGYYLANKQTKK